MRPARPLLIAMAVLLTAQDVPTVGHLVFPSSELEIATAPGVAPHGRLGASPALVLAKDGDWYRLLGANGSTGWTVKLAGATGPVQIQATEWWSQSPDDADFANGTEPVALEAGEKIALIGASENACVPSIDKLMLPEHANPFLSPWLHLRGESRTGWQAPSLLSLRYTAPVAGIVRAPFLSAQSPTPRKTPGQTVWHFSDLRSEPRRTGAELGNFPKVEMLLGLPADSKQKIAAMTVHEGQTGRLFTFRMVHGEPIYAVVESYPPLVTAFVTADLDADGANELLLEMVQTYGDGWFSTLWIVDGNSTDAAFRMAAVPLGGSGGEPGASRLDAAWWVENHRLWIVGGGDHLTASSATFRRGKLSAMSGPAYAAVTGRTRTSIEAQRLAWAGQKRLRRPVHVFRHAASTHGNSWMAGILFTSLAGARSVAGTEVVRIPSGGF